MNQKQNINKSLHHTEHLASGDFFLQAEMPCTKIGMLTKGVMRGFVVDDDGNEVSTHFFLEGDMIIASFLPGIKTSMTIQALENCEVSVANYSEVMSHVHRNQEITDVITREFQKLNGRLQSRLVSLLNLNALEKYEGFLNDYPGLLNRIPHYYIAQYLGITPTQLSRVRKQFVNKCK